MKDRMASPEFQDAILVEAFRRVHFLDHVFPVVFDSLTRTESFELSIVASGKEPAEISACRQEGLFQSVDDYNKYLEGGVNALGFDESFMSHLTQRFKHARLMASPNN